MTHAQPGRRDACPPVVEGLPVDPDVDPGRAPFARVPGPPRAPVRLRPPVVAAIACGGFAGGLARYGIGLALPTAPLGFAWATVVVNTAGTLVLVLLLVLVAELRPPGTYLRPALGTGFCGAFTTFSSVVAVADELAAHARLGTACGYLLVSTAAGLAAAWAGLVAGRALLAGRRRAPERGD